MHLLTVSGISKKEEQGFSLSDISFNQDHGQKIAIVGETGSGKSTLLRIIAGLLQPDSGTVTFEGQRVKGPHEKLLPGHPRIAYLSQHYELRNHYRMEELLDMSSRLPVGQAAKIYEVCRIDHLMKRKVQQLSGGERQRIALAAMLTSAPLLFVLDEPYSNLDLIHKRILKDVLENASAEFGITLLMASHEPEDVLPWADEIIVLRAGRIIQQSEPKTIYRSPLNEYVAGLFGKYNKAPATLFDATLTESHHFLRPEDLRITVSGNGPEGRIGKVSYMGSHYEIEVHLSAVALSLVVFSKTPFEPGTPVQLEYKAT